MRITIFPCVPAANESELKAFEHLKSCLQSEPGDAEWVPLTSLPFSVTDQLQSEVKRFAGKDVRGVLFHTLNDCKGALGVGSPHVLSPEQVARLGSGGVGTTFKVVEIDRSTKEELGTYIAKVAHEGETGP